MPPDSTQPELLLVGVGFMGQPYLAAARRLGLRVRAVEGAARAPHLADHVDGVYVARGNHDELWAEAAWAAAADGRPNGVIAFTEWNVLGAALLQDRLGLPGPSLHAAAVSRNKALQRGLFGAAGIRQPDYVLTDQLETVEDWVATRLPVVVKPLSLAGSEGVEFIPDLGAFRDIEARRSGKQPVLVEAAVDGPEYSWEALVRDGTVWLANTTAKETTDGRYFVEVAHRAGVQFDAKQTAQVEEFSAAVLASLGMRTGVVHLEFRMAADGPTLMEIAVRTPGDYLMELLGLTYGVDWFEMCIRLAMSMPLPAVPSGSVAHAASYFPIAPPGRVVAVEGLDEIQAHPSVVTHGLWKNVGDVVPTTASNADRAGFVIVSAETPEGREDALDFVRRTLVVRTDEA